MYSCIDNIHLTQSAFETMLEVMEKADSLRNLSLGRVMLHAQQQRARNPTPGRDFLYEGTDGSGGGGDVTISPGTQFTVRSEADVEAQKRWRKEQRKAGRQLNQRQAAGGGGGGGGGDMAKDWLLDLGFDELYLEEERALGLQVLLLLLLSQYMCVALND
jgi:hypothetical protein